MPIDTSKLGNRSDWEALAREVCDAKVPLAAVLELAASGTRREAQRAGYVLFHVHRQCPKSLSPHLSTLVSLLQNPPHDSIPRQVFSILQDRTVPHELAGRVFAKAVDTWLDQRAPVAARARALGACANVARQYERLWSELAELTDAITEHDAPGIRSVARRVKAEAHRNLR